MQDDYNDLVQEFNNKVEKEAELWKIYCTMPILGGFKEKDDYNIAMYKWAIKMEKKFAELGQTDAVTSLEAKETKVKD